MFAYYFINKSASHFHSRRFGWLWCGNIHCCMLLREIDLFCNSIVKWVITSMVTNHHFNNVTLTINNTTKFHKCFIFNIFSNVHTIAHKKVSSSCELDYVQMFRIRCKNTNTDAYIDMWTCDASYETALLPCGAR